MNIKQLLGQIHLWIGLPISILFFIIAISGAIYSWAPEISRVIYHQSITPQNQPFVPVSTLHNTLAKEFPEGDFRTAMYQGKSMTAQVLLYVPGTYYHAFLNPYTGELIHLQDMKKGWLNKIKMLHRNLLLGDIGREMVHWVTLLFFVMMVSGLVLWWPPRKAARKQRFSIKWSASPKRLNYDLHNVLGFYATWIALLCVMTGLFWGFEGIRNGLKAVTGENEMVYDSPKSDENKFYEDQDQFVLLDSLASDLLANHPDKFVRISNPHGKTDIIRATVIDPSFVLNYTDHLYFDRYTGQRLSGHFENGLQGEGSSYHTLHHWVYDVHFGTAFGFLGRLLVFLATVIFASLPITGFVVWWGKRKRK